MKPRQLSLSASRPVAGIAVPLPKFLHLGPEEFPRSLSRKPYRGPFRLFGQRSPIAEQEAAAPEALVEGGGPPSSSI
jgi:hypothetical protein